jgi:hypothetical protein
MVRPRLCLLLLLRGWDGSALLADAHGARQRLHVAGWH